MSRKLDALVITDCDGSEEQEKVLDSVISRVSKADINWKDVATKFLTSKDKKDLLDLSAVSIPEETFKEKYRNVQRYLDRDRLMLYSRKTDPELYADLKQGKDIGQALWSVYSRSLHDTDWQSWDSEANYVCLVRDEASKKGYPNVLEILLNHRVVSADFGSPDSIPYHMIGRGFVAEGCYMSLFDKQYTDTGKKLVLLPLSLYDEKDRVDCAYELINHEIVGHYLLGLKDHSVSDVDPEDCIMSVPDDRKWFVELAKKRRGVVLCPDCRKVYEDSPLYQSRL